MASKKGRHQSVGKELKPNILWLESLPFVRRVILGFCKSCRHKYPPGLLRYQKDEQGGVKLIGYSGNGVINIFIAVDRDNKQSFLKLLEKRFK